MKSVLRQIGRIRTPYRKTAVCPRNVDPEGPECELEIDVKYRDGLTGLAAGDKILVLYWFDNVDRDTLLLRRPGSERLNGVFALRSPHRPNPIAVAVVDIKDIVEGSIRVRGMDCLDGTPLLDIKPAIFAHTAGDENENFVG